MRTIQIFLLRVVNDDTLRNDLQGNISEPASDDDWRATFRTVQELLEQLRRRVGTPTGEIETKWAPRQKESSNLDSGSE